MTQFFNMKKEYWREHYADALPPGYRRVEYLESTGEQYINSGWMLGASDKVKLHIRINKLQSAHVGIFGSYTNGSNGYYFYHTAANHLQCGYGSRYQNDGDMPVGEYWLESFGGKFYVNDELVIDLSSATFAKQTRTAYLFWYNYNTSDLKMIGRYYSAVIFNGNGIKVRRFIPCVRISDSKPGMYDLCGSISAKTGTSFYVNEGTGADFLWGELQ